MPLVQRSFVENIKFTYRCRFLSNFLSKNPKLQKEDILQELDALEKEYGEIKYFTRGFVINFGKIFVQGFDFGNLTCLFHIDRPLNLLSVTDSNRAYMQKYRISNTPKIELSTIFAIHPNIHLEDLAENYNDEPYIKFYENNPFILELKDQGAYIDDAKHAMIVCLGEVEPIYNGYIKAGMFTAAFQAVIAMLNNADNEDCLYNDFNLPCCECCDEAITYEDSLKSSNFCPFCLPNEKEGSVSMSRHDIEDDDFEDDDIDDFEDDDFEDDDFEDDDDDDEFFNFEDDDDFDDEDDDDFFDDDDDEEEDEDL